MPKDSIGENIVNDTTSIAVENETAAAPTIINEMVRTKYRPIHMNRVTINDGPLLPNQNLQHCVTWNIDGYTEDKLIVLEMIMQNYNIDILCIQETYVTANDHFITDASSLITFPAVRKKHPLESASSFQHRFAKQFIVSINSLGAW